MPESVYLAAYTTDEWPDVLPLEGMDEQIAALAEVLRSSEGLFNAAWGREDELPALAEYEPW